MTLTSFRYRVKNGKGYIWQEGVEPQVFTECGSKAPSDAQKLIEAQYGVTLTGYRRVYNDSSEFVGFRYYSE